MQQVSLVFGMFFSIFYKCLKKLCFVIMLIDIVDIVKIDIDIVKITVKERLLRLQEKAAAVLIIQCEFESKCI